MLEAALLHEGPYGAIRRFGFFEPVRQFDQWMTAGLGKSY